MNPILSICIPTYNRAEYLAQTLESIVRQKGFEAIEVVISDNCSSDRTRDVAMDYVGRYPANITYSRNEENLADANFRKVLSLGRGDFLKLLNDTAPLRPDALECMLSTICSAKKLNKTLPFFLNGNLGDMPQSVCGNLDEFLRETKYFGTWIAAFGVWRDMLPEVMPILEATTKTKLTQSWVLMTLVSHGWKILVESKVLFDSVTPTKKGGYNVAEVFGHNYNDMLRHFHSQKVLSGKAYERAKKDIMFFVNRYYFDVKGEFAFNKTGYFKWMCPLYWNKPYFYSGLCRVLGKYFKCGLRRLKAQGERLILWRNLWWWPRWKVPSFLMLHSVGDDVTDESCPNNTIRPREVRDLIVALRKDGYTFKTFKDAIETGDRWTMCLTFDDGFVDNYTLLFPILKELDVPATLFVTSRGKSDNGFLSPDMIREMDASGLVELGGHTSGHTMLTEVSLEEAKREIDENKAWIEAIIGHPIISFAYPRGGENDDIVELVKGAGYRYGAAMVKKMRPVETDLFRVHRQIIPRGMPTWKSVLLATRGKWKL